MQSRRAARTRASINENTDENSTRTTTTRLTRAKAASLTTGQGSTLIAKTGTVNTTTTAASRKRAALGDVSNVHKPDVPGGDKKVVKKVVKATIKTSINGTTKSARITRAVPSKTTVSSQDKRKDTNGSSTLRSKKRLAPAKVKEDIEEVDEEEEVVEDLDEQELVDGDVNQESVVSKPVENDKSSRPPAAKRPRVEKPKTAAEVTGWQPLDDEDKEDPLMVSEYVNEIFDYLRKLEPETQPNPNYMDDQIDLRWQMRGILVDWLVEVHTRFRLLPETLFLAVNIVDRFLTNKIVMLDKLELVGVTAMFIAAKYEEVFSPHVQYFRHVADDGFTEDEILRAERFILATLDYNLSYPNPMNFLRRISKADQYDFQTRTFAKYLIEISLLDHRFLEFLPSHVSAAAMYMARMMLHRGAWDANLIHFSDYTEEQILPVFRMMIDYLIRPVKHQAFFKKYASKKFMKASLHARDWAKKNAKAHGVDTDLANRDLYQDDEL